MAYTTNKAIRRDDSDGLNIATKSETAEDAVTKHFQRVIIEDGTTIGQQLAIDASGRITALLAAGTNTNEVVGDVADDATAAGNPVQVGALVKSFDSTDPGAVSAEGDAASLIADNNRRLYVNPVHPNFWSVSADYGAAQTNATVKAAPGAGLKLYITRIMISNGAVAGNITLLDGSGGAVVYEIYPAINGGVAESNMNPPIALTANTLLAITSTSVTTHVVNIGGYVAP